MPDIRYVVLSDLHFGGESSILTSLRRGGVEPEPRTPSAVVTLLVECLAELISRNEGPEKPTLVLCGDILELALATDNVAAMAFERFVEAIFPRDGGLFDSTIYFVPGNHDHHIWEAARERQYSAYLRHPAHGPGTDLEVPWHTTRMSPTPGDPEAVEAELLTTLINRYPHLENVKVLAVYPNLRLTGGSRSVVIHHGHFVEGIYRLMSTMKDLVYPGRPPVTKVWQWEQENFAWIDFFWSTLGRSGEVGTDVGLLYASMRDERAMNALAHDLAGTIMGRRTVRQPRRWIEGKALDFALVKVARRMRRLERNEPRFELTGKTAVGLDLYLRVPLLEQLYDELDRERRDGIDALPQELTFVFGHTHKPFEKVLPPPRGYPGPVEVYNTGGWVVDSDTPAPFQGGAAILIDEELNVASLRVYNQGSYRVRLAQAGGAPTPFFDRLDAMIHPDAPPWSALAAVTERVVDERRDAHRRLIERGPVRLRPPAR